MLKKIKKKSGQKDVTIGKIYIQSTFNNTIITIADNHGNALSSSSSGSLGFKGAKKTTPYAAQLVMQTAVEKAKNIAKIQQASIYISGVGNGREASIKALHNSGINITTITDVTPVPHNGCRPKKIRRV